MTQEELQTLVDKADQANNLGNFDEAEQLANEVLAELEKSSDSAQAHNSVERLRANALLALAVTGWRQGKYDAALEQSNKALALAEEYSLQEMLPKAWINIGNVYTLLASFDKALEYYNKALKAHEEVGEKSALALVTGNIGNVYLNLGSYDRALEYFLKALAIHEDNGEKSVVASILANIGIAYGSLGSYDNSLQYFYKSLSTFDELGSKSGIAIVTGNIGNVYLNLGSYDKALEFYCKALATQEKLGIKSEVARIMGNIGIVYRELGSYHKALEYYRKALSINEELGIKSEVARSIENIGSLFATQKFEGYNADQAEEYLLKAIAISEETGAKLILYETEKAIADLYEQTGHWQESYKYFKKFYELEKEVQSEETKKQADRLAYERREAEREKQLATERARLEEREKIIDELTELNESLHEANRQKNEVLGIVAHDLKNPLAAILLSSGTLTRYLPNLNQDEILDQLGRIKSTAERMNQIILNLLDIQKLEAGKLSLELKPLEISSILRTMSKNFKEQAQRKNIKIKTEIPDFLTALAENSAFQEILENLISNALKFSPFDKNIFVRAESFDQFVRISIQDEGPGLTDDDKSKLFGQFTRLSAKPTGGEHSTGLGLSIVKRMVEMMNGKIWCESELGKGATFIVELPKVE